MQFLHGTNIDFVGVRRIFIIASTIITVCGFIMFTFILKPERSIDFVGGTEVAIQFSKSVNTQDIRNIISKAGIPADEIKSYGKENQFLIRSKETGTIANHIEEVLTKAFPGNQVTILKKDTIGPKIGAEIEFQALLAVILAVIAMLLYIAFRFEFIFGLGAIVALVHDVIFTFTIIVLFHHLGIMNLELNQSIVGALLTVVGYSVHDTVIIFDRIRENRVKHKGMNFIKMINLSINETLSRTINTVLTVVLVLMTMVLFAGPVLQGFAFTMLVGTLIGTYSSIYIASSFVIWYLEKFRKVDMDTHEVDKKKSIAPAKA